MFETLKFQGREYQIGGDPSHRPISLPDWLVDVLPPRWAEVDTKGSWGDGDRDYFRAYGFRGNAILVLVSCASFADGKRWLHVSVSRKDSIIPSWEQMSLIKEIFIGADRQAIQVMPSVSKHVNIHTACLHPYHCLDGDGLPDFTAGGQTI